MSNQTDAPSLSDLTDTDKALLGLILGGHLDSHILYSVLHGLYTGVVAVTLGNIFMTPNSQPIGKATIVAIILLYIVTTIDFGLDVSFIHSMFVNNAENIVTKYLFSNSTGSIIVGFGTTSVICSVLADATMIWRCWIVWGRRWLPILLPILLLISATVVKIIITYKTSIIPGVYNQFFILYSSSVLATTLWCTILIIYRIVTVVRAGGGGLRAYRHVIEVFIESSALYSITLIVYIGMYSHNDWTAYYITVIAAVVRGISPTLLIGRVAAGHARPDESWQGSVISGSIRFGTHPVGQDSQLVSMTSDDLEAQAAEWKRDEEYGHHARADFQGDNGSQSVVREDGTEAQMETPEDSHGYNENDVHGDDLEAHPHKPRDDPHAIFVVPKD